MVGPYENSLWYIETNTHPLLESAKVAPKMVNYIRPSFWSRFLELNSVMWETNAGLTERHAYDSRPSTWPVLRRGINFWTADHKQVYLIGNPFIWWGALCSIMVYFGARAILMLRAKRGHKDFQDTVVVYYDQTCGFLALGWAMHFLPFFTMHRQLFIHHYLPALYFSILLLAVLFDLLTAGLKPKYRFIAALTMIAIAFASYSTYSPVTYATPWTAKSCERARLLKTWDLNCKDYPESYSAYSKGKGMPVDNSTHVGSEATGDVLQQAVVAQAGNHPFEQAPQMASVSASLDGVPPAKEAADVNKVADKPAADKVQGGAADPKPAAPVAVGTAEAPAGQAESEKKSAPPHDTVIPKAAHAVDPQALDAEALEGVVLQGTSIIDAKKPVASAATTPSQAAKA